MKILLCPDKFKGSLSAYKVCVALRQGLLSVDECFDIISLPMADGGDGSIDILKTKLNLDILKVQTLDPLGRSIEAEYYHSTNEAFIELASASGLVLLDENERNPMFTSTFGTGLLIKDAINRGFTKIYLFIGGSATNDGGVGIANALGYKFLDASGMPLDPIGQNLRDICLIDDKDAIDIENIQLTVLCDVINPMHGPEGAAYSYGAQKGASNKDIHTLDEGLINYASILELYKNDNLMKLPGMGAAGAVAASLVGLCNAQLLNGFQMLSRIIGLEEDVKTADLVITGEGRVDSTSFQGKVVGNVLRYCKDYDIPCGIVGGSIDESEKVNQEFEFWKSVMPLAHNLEEAMLYTEDFLYQIGVEIGFRIAKLEGKKKKIKRY